MLWRFPQLLPENASPLQAARWRISANRRTLPVLPSLWWHLSLMGFTGALPAGHETYSWPDCPPSQTRAWPVVRRRWAGQTYSAWQLWCPYGICAGSGSASSPVRCSANGWPPRGLPGPEKPPPAGPSCWAALLHGGVNSALVCHSTLSAFTCAKCVWPPSADPRPPEPQSSGSCPALSAGANTAEALLVLSKPRKGYRSSGSSG